MQRCLKLAKMYLKLQLQASRYNLTTHRKEKDINND